MEDMVMRQCFSGVYAGRRVLITGHTGFKGSWLGQWLTAMGAEVAGLGLDPLSKPSHCALLSGLNSDHRIDIRNASSVERVFAATQPEIVFHLAAQPLVRRSYREPVETWATNVLGTAHVLEAVRMTSSVRAAVLVTTDKCYENQEWQWPYREIDRLGGHDPYSASKAATELVVSSYRRSFFRLQGGPLLATARAGNVIGGGDWSEDRLIPDSVRAITEGRTLMIRSPQATRPWQHVLDCLSGYLLLGQQLLAGKASLAEAWNFGPSIEDARSVEETLKHFQKSLGVLKWEVSKTPELHEASRLQLDSSKARIELGWRPVWTFEDAVQRTATWYRLWMTNNYVATGDDLSAYVADARLAGLNWAIT